MVASGGPGPTYALLGSPVGHSRSPRIYNQLFERCGLSARYLALERDPERPELIVAALRRGELLGANLTAPLKERLLPLLDALAPEAAAAGAVNVLTLRDDRVTGHNTDGAGLIRALQAEGRGVVGARAVVLGAGGTARGVAAALLSAGVASLSLLNRTPQRASRVASELEARFSASVGSGPLTPEVFSILAAGADLVLNCTAGEAAARVATLDPAVLAPGAGWVDVNYWMDDPPHATARGLRFYTGHGMLLHQALLAFEIFTGHRVPPDGLMPLVVAP